MMLWVFSSNPPCLIVIKKSSHKRGSYVCTSFLIVSLVFRRRACETSRCDGNWCHKPLNWVATRRIVQTAHLIPYNDRAATAVILRYTARSGNNCCHRNGWTGHFGYFKWCSAPPSQTCAVTGIRARQVYVEMTRWLRQSVCATPFQRTSEGVFTQNGRRGVGF